MATTLETTDFKVEQGDSLTFVVGPVKLLDPVTNALAPVDLTAGGTAIWLTAKKALADADPGQFQKTIGSGITPNSPASADKNFATITVDPADTEALTSLPQDLRYDVQLKEPNNRKTTIVRGTISVVADVTNA